MEYKRGKQLTEFPADYTVFDIETTGFSPNYDAIIEISAVRVRKHTAREEFTTLINPERPIPYSASNINHIYDDMVADAPVFEEAMEKFLAFIGDDILVGHNIHTFDLNFVIMGLANRMGVEMTNDYIDSLSVAKKVLPKGTPMKLTDLAERFHVSGDGAHRALNDCRMNYLIFEELGKLLEMNPLERMQGSTVRARKPGPAKSGGQGGKGKASAAKQSGSAKPSEGNAGDLPWVTPNDSTAGAASQRGKISPENAGLPFLTGLLGEDE